MKRLLYSLSLASVFFLSVSLSAKAEDTETELMELFDGSKTVCIAEFKKSEFNKDLNRFVENFLVRESLKGDRAKVGEVLVIKHELKPIKELKQVEESKKTGIQIMSPPSGSLLVLFIRSDDEQQGKLSVENKNINRVCYTAEIKQLLCKKLGRNLKTGAMTNRLLQYLQNNRFNMIDSIKEMEKFQNGQSDSFYGIDLIPRQKKSQPRIIESVPRGGIIMPVPKGLQYQLPPPPKDRLNKFLKKESNSYPGYDQF